VAGVVGQTEGGVKEVIDERRKGFLSLFPFALFSPSPPLPFLYLPRRLRKVLLLRYSIQLGFLGVLHSCPLVCRVTENAGFISLFMHLFFDLNGFSSFTGI